MYTTVLIVKAKDSQKLSDVLKATSLEAKRISNNSIMIDEESTHQWVEVLESAQIQVIQKSFGY